jgi:hypothetical protein
MIYSGIGGTASWKFKIGDVVGLTYAPDNRCFVNLHGFQQVEVSRATFFTIEKEKEKGHA